MVVEGEVAQGPHDGAQSFIASAPLARKSKSEALDNFGTHIVDRAAQILGLQPHKFHLNSVPFAWHGVDPLIGMVLQIWLFKRFEFQASVHALRNLNTTF
ncbi:putative polyketide synthase [Penicillium digitatum]|uniref:Putative polyketide synthase n=1 Tax=Penicillium digitatum TaxID=36651 RepID=A0A7T7BIQ6_PENDI|nr:putative polyketide synthase [Penicillium digitatum]